MTNSQNQASLRTTIVIIGAGLAGLSAAHKLAQQDIDLVVLEASSRVGGRTYTIQTPDGTYLDLGGQWIGPTQKYIGALVAEFGITTFPTYETGNTVGYHDGQRIIYPGTTPLSDPQAATEIEYAIRTLDSMALQVPVEAPWQAAQAELWDSQTAEQWMRAHITSTIARDWLNAFFFESVFAASPRALSLLHVLFYIHAAGEMRQLLDTAGSAQDRRFHKGAQQISLALAHELGDRIHLNCPVHTLQQNDQEVIVIADHIRVQAQRAIIAIPPTIAGRLHYHPPLPAIRDHLTQRMPMGAVIKFQCLYENTFWRKEGLSGLAIGNIGALSIIMDNSPENGTPGILVGFIEADQALLWTDRTIEERRTEVLTCLTRFFGPQAAHPTQYIEHSWLEEPYIRGGYVSYMPPGVWTSVGHALRTPIGRLHWAGTETATTWNGYMDGAVQSGERAATEVLAILK